MPDIYTHNSGDKSGEQWRRERLQLRERHRETERERETDRQTGESQPRTMETLLTMRDIELEFTGEWREIVFSL